MNKKILALAIGAGVLVYLVTRNKNVAGTPASNSGLPQAQPSTNPATTTNPGIVTGYTANANPFDNPGSLDREPEEGSTIIPATATTTPLKIGDIAKAGPQGAIAYITIKRGTGAGYWTSTGLELGTFTPGAQLGRIIATTTKNDGFVIQLADNSFAHFAFADLMK